MYKRYFIILAAILLAIALDAFIFMGILGVPYSRVPSSYHFLNIVLLSAALTIFGDMIFKGDVLR